jgi:glycine hydroxymethyltransferase
MSGSIVELGKGMSYSYVRDISQDIADALVTERQDQQEKLLMIASENYASKAVMEAQGSVLTNRNALGYPDSRLYPGSENIDRVEQLAIDYAKELWDAEHVNVQPHSGSLANLSVYLSMLEPSDRILSLDPIDGGHVTHGHDMHISGELYEVDHYRVDPETGRIDYNDLADRAEAFEPDLIIAGYSAYPREIDWKRIKSIADAVGAYLLADIAHTSGLIAAGNLTSPIGIAQFATSSTYKTIRAGRGGFIMCDEEYADSVDAATFPGSQGGASMPNIAGKAVGFAEALQPGFEKYASQTIRNAKALASVLADRGINVVSGGTDTHIVLVDLRDSHPDVTGKQAEAALEEVGIIATKATVPGETRPIESSGIRLGTPPLTTRGFDTDAMERVGDCIVRAIDDLGRDRKYEDLRRDIGALCAEYPLYDE